MKLLNSIDWLHRIRGYELEQIMQFLPKKKNIKILEIGSGSGYMISVLEKKFVNVKGLEIENSAYENNNDNIIMYDGKSIPFKASSFDIILTSHVLEHILDIDSFLNEISRVLKPKGLAIHIIPSPTWRFLTSLFHYFAILNFIYKYLLKIDTNELNKKIKKASKLKKVKMLFFSPRHGERGNVITELYYFSKKFWIKVFIRNYYKIDTVKPSGIIYWGNDTFKNSLSFKFRCILSNIVGSSSIIYVLKNEK